MENQRIDYDLIMRELDKAGFNLALKAAELEEDSKERAILIKMIKAAYAAAGFEISELINNEDEYYGACDCQYKKLISSFFSGKNWLNNEMPINAKAAWLLLDELSNDEDYKRFILDFNDWHYYEIASYQWGKMDKEEKEGKEGKEAKEKMIFRNDKRIIDLKLKKAREGLSEAEKAEIVAIWENRKNN